MIGDTPKISAAVEIRGRRSLTGQRSSRRRSLVGRRLATGEAKKSHWQGCQSEARGYVRRRAGASPCRRSALSAWQRRQLAGVPSRSAQKGDASGGSYQAARNAHAGPNLKTVCEPAGHVVPARVRIFASATNGDSRESDHDRYVTVTSTRVVADSPHAVTPSANRSCSGRRP